MNKSLPPLLNEHDVLDKIKLERAKAVLERNSMEAIRAKSLANLARWESQGTWCSAYGEWRTLMTSGTEEEIIAAMTGENQTANRLRQSSPYSGLLDEETRLAIAAYWRKAWKGFT